MPLTREQFQQLREKGLSVEQIARFESGQKPAAPTPTPQGPTGLKGLFSGILKGAQSTVANIGSLGQRGLETITGIKSQTPTLTKTLGNRLAPRTTSEKIGYGAEQVAEFFLPAGAASKIGKALTLAGKGTKAIRRAKLATEALGIAGTTIAQGGNLKDVAGNVATAGAFGLAAKGVSKVVSKTAPRIINSLIKPLSKDFQFGKNPGLGIVQEKITANSFDDLIKKVASRRNEVGEEISKVLQRPNIAKRTVDASKALSPVDEAIQKAASRGDQKLVDALTEFRGTLTNTFTLSGGTVMPTPRQTMKLSVLDTFDLKKKVGDSVRWREGLDQEVNKVKTAVYRNLRDELDNAVETARKTDSNIPSLKSLNERYANLTSAETAAKYRANVQKRLNLTTLGGGLAGVLVSGPSAVQNVKEGDFAGLLGDLAVVGGLGLSGKALASVALKTRIAKGLAALSPEERGLVSQAIPLLRNVVLARNARPPE